MGESVPDRAILDEAAFAQRIEAIAVEIENRAGNYLYCRAWKVAARIVRRHKHAQIQIKPE
jgi:hypothetical protein